MSIGIMLDVLIDWGLAMWSSAFVDSADGLSKMQAILKQHISYHITTFTIYNLQFTMLLFSFFYWPLSIDLNWNEWICCKRNVLSLEYWVLNFHHWTVHSVNDFLLFVLVFLAGPSQCVFQPVGVFDVLSHISMWQGDLTEKTEEKKRFMFFFCQAAM